MSDETKPSQRVSMDFTLPLWGMMTVIGGGFVLLVGLFFTVNSLNDNVKDLKITVQTGNTAYSSLASRTTLIEFRVENNSSELKALVNRANDRDNERRANK